jgi:DNA polymerase III subunit epsilon
MKNLDLTFLDLETTGLSPYHERIIEVGAIRVKNGKTIQTYNTLVDPQQKIKYYITQITGISQKDILGKPIFHEISDELLEIIGDSIVVAHNARFDYGFLKTELLRDGHNLKNQFCCSMVMSRQLYPEHRRHNLDSIIERFELDCAHRHRALDDAMLVHEFFQRIFDEQNSEMVEEIIRSSIIAGTRGI